MERHFYDLQGQKPCDESTKIHGPARAIVDLFVDSSSVRIQDGDNQAKVQK
jgi:hypothetical protein